MIRNKIKRVPDVVCRRCSQFYHNSCRAFQMPHSAKERRHRERSKPKCMGRNP